MLIPLTTDRPQRRYPLATWAILVVNIALFVVMAGLEPSNRHGFERAMNALTLDPVAVGLQKAPVGVFAGGREGGLDGQPFYGARVPLNSGGWWTFLTYQFLHGGFLHILGNLLVLWVFGPSVEDRFGRVGFVLFYLFGGVLAGVMHGAFNASPVIGASGSIAAVTGAFLVLFPRTHIKVLLFFILIGVYELPAWVFILFAVIKDIWGLGTSGGEVAFLAHIGGYLFGFTVAMGLMVTKLLPDEDYSLFAIARHAKRRADFKASAREADAEWKQRTEKSQKPSAQRDERRAGVDEGATGRGAGYGGRLKPGAGGVEERVLWQRMDSAEARAIADAQGERESAMRADLASKVDAQDADAACRAFRTLEREGGEGSLLRGNRRVLVDAGNLFTAHGRHRDAADAYEAFLASLKGFSDAEEGRVRLMLALVCHRYLKQPERAAAALKGIKGSFTDPELHALAELLRDELRARA